MNKKIVGKLLVIIGVLSLFVIAPFTSSIIKKSLATDNAVSLADWNVALNQNANNSFTILANGTDTASYTVNITGTAEVDIRYEIKISNLSAGVQVDFDNRGFEPHSNGTIVINNITPILYSDVNKTRTHTLTFKALTGATPVNNRVIDIDVVATQILSNAS